MRALPGLVITIEKRGAMTTRARLFRGGVALAAAAVLLVGCTSGNGGNSGNEGGTGSSSGTTDGANTSAAIITTNSNEPQDPLITYATNEVGGGKVLTALYAGLVSYAADGSTQNELADSIESDDNITWTIKLKGGSKFTNGEDVTAQTFVDTWSHAAQDPQGAYWFANIEGVSEDGSTAPTGLTAVDDKTFTVKLKAPEIDFPLRLGHIPYMPLPKEAFDNIKAFGENPIGNGPYKMDGEGAWKHDESISLVANPDYDGNRKAVNGGIKFVFYTSQDAAYADVQSGNLDVLDAVPDTAFKTYTNDFPDRNVNQPAAIFQAINIPYYLDHWKADDEGKLRRAAISMAINRDEITKTIFESTRTPASDFSSPVVQGWSDSIPGSEVLKYNPDEAKKLWAQADAISPYGDTTFTIAYNADGGHQAWVDAVANSLKNVLGINAEGKSYPDFKQSLQVREDHTLDGATRAGWQADFPSQSNFLSGLYQSNAPSNYEQYESPEFDDLLKQGAAAKTTDESLKIYQQAQELLFKDLPAIPLWYSNAVGVWSDQVSNVAFGWDSVPLYYQITKS